MCVLHNVITFDAEGLFDSSGALAWYEQWIQLGRWNLVLLKKVLGVGIINPYFSTALFLLLFPLSAFLWMYLFQGRLNMGIASGEQIRRVQFVLFGVVYLVQPVWALQFGYRNQMDVISFVLILMPISLIVLLDFLKERNAIIFAILICLLTACVGSYQSFIFMYVAGVCGCLLIWLWSRNDMKGDFGKDPTKSFWASVGWSVLAIIVAFVLSTMINRLFIKHYAITTSTSYLSAQFMWGKRPLTQNISFIATEVWDCVRGSGVGGSVWFGIAFIVAACILVYRSAHAEVFFGPSVVVLIMMFVAPFLLLLATAGAIVLRSQFSFVLVLAFIVSFDFGEVAVLIQRELEGRKTSNYLRMFLVLVAFFALVPSLNNTTRLMYTQVRTLDQDYSQLQAIYYEALENGVKEGDAACFVGSKADFQDDSMLEFEQMGYSYLEVVQFQPGVYSSGKTAQAMRAMGLNVSVPTDEQQHEALGIAEKMRAWPDSGGIVVKNGYFVVRLQ